MAERARTSAHVPGGARPAFGSLLGKQHLVDDVDDAIGGFDVSLEDACAVDEDALTLAALGPQMSALQRGNFGTRGSRVGVDTPGDDVQLQALPNERTAGSTVRS